MKEYRFGNLTPGYCGIWDDKSSLNSQFLGLIPKDYLRQNLPFPVTQRLPRSGFFDELITTELPDAKLGIAAYRREILERLEEYSPHKRSRRLNEPDGRFALSLFNLALRLGLTPDLTVNFDLKHQTTSFQLLRFETFANAAISDSREPDYSPLEKIFKEYALDRETPPVVRLLICIRAAVSITRHQHAAVSRDIRLRDSSFEVLEKLIDEFSPNSFSEHIAYAMAMRALPMRKEIASAKKIEMMNQSLEFIRSMKPSSLIERIILSELLLTTELSAAKTFIAAGMISDADTSFSTMISCDPYDSTAYGELALHCMKTDRKDLAIRNFQRASELGPPALAMNYFFLG